MVSSFMSLLLPLMCCNSSHINKLCIITSNHWQSGVNVLGLLNRFSTWSVKCWTVNFCIHASKCPVIIVHQLKSLYNSPLKNSYSHPIHTCFPKIASNEFEMCHQYYNLVGLLYRGIRESASLLQWVTNMDTIHTHFIGERYSLLGSSVLSRCEWNKPH